MNKRCVLICGSDGYIGHALTLRLLNKGYKVIGIDDYRRRDAVREMGSFSATVVNTIAKRGKVLAEYGDFEYGFLTMEDNNGYDNLCRLFKEHKVDIIVNLAQQPSAPYSHKSVEHNISTTQGNLIGTINLLHAINDVCPDTPLVQIGSMGEYNPATGAEIPEGVFDFPWKGNVVRNAIFPRSPGSFYHASKVASTYYIDFACRAWNLRATDIMQGVVFGNWTPEIKETGLQTRLDSDEAFGTVLNRFIIQALIGHPLTIYGEGDHMRGFLALNDSVQCLMLAIENPPTKGEYRTWNQLDMSYTMNNLANEVVSIGNTYDLNVQIQHIDSPRVEKTDKFEYKPVVEKLFELGFEPTRDVEAEVTYLFDLLYPNIGDLLPLKNVVIPEIKWRQNSEENKESN
jgi:UDP-sulfoquinovose synthase